MENDQQTENENTATDWRPVFEDDGRRDWEAKWFRDGEASILRNTPEGMEYTTGPVDKGDAAHEVIWTRESFNGDLRIEYDFTRLDANKDHVSVCILFLHATGAGDLPEDVLESKEERRVPSMPLYFQHMNLLHVSYACTGGDDNRYVRVRQYPLGEGGFAGMQVDPSYENVDAFQPGENWHMIFEKVGEMLSLTASKGGETHTWSWNLAGRPDLNHGRIGLRQMRGRSSLIANFKVFEASTAGELHHSPQHMHTTLYSETVNNTH